MNKGTLRRVALALAAPIAAVVFATVASSIFLIIAGSNPFSAYGDMFEYGSRLEIQVDILNRATPLYISGVAAAIGFRMNLFNIGVEGQYRLAAIVAAYVGASVSLPAFLHVALILFVAMLVGGAYAGVAGVLKVTRGVNEVISTIMLNAIAISGLIAWLVREWQAGGSVDAKGANLGVGTEPIEESGLIPNINSWLELFTREIGKGKELTGVLLVAIAVGVLYHIILNRTRFGFDLRASGINPFAARAGGVNDKRMVLGAMVLSGVVAGLVGMAEIAKLGRFSPNFVGNLGFAGIAVALLGRNHPGGIAIGALLFAFLDTASGVLQVTGSASREIVFIMQGIILLAAVIAYEVVQRYRIREEARLASTLLSGDQE
ncbi:MAG: ABC transporter permease [Acidimicrobiales bacterium]|jgi:simple sugar transport system permease protein|nr:ABC transporter permease [Acidimicrobiales bacterium]MDP6297958.1 ABC transporter permease [Acidimicrobiales bacterium]HJM27931.1 ABC transporter permease [Acidimicrobiales bacterium]HJM97319.1 ABC transporter permease [Acidimicrobiales bacterium]